MGKIRSKATWRPTDQGGRRRPWLATFAGLVAASSYAGFVGLAFGDIDLGAEIMARLPFGSAVFAGVALALVVAVPMTVAAYLCATGHRHAPLSAIVAGAALVGWIAVQIGVVRSYSWLQPVSAFAGLVVMLAGLRAFPRVGDITSSRRS